MTQQLQQIEAKLKLELDAKRYHHTIGVMYTAGSLAMCHQSDLNQAMTAGLLHDCAKCIPSEEKLELCRKYEIPINEVEQRNPDLLHAKLGAYLAEQVYDIHDPEILDAIRCHTTGRPRMTLLDKILYIADYMEPYRRELPNMAEVRYLAYRDIDACLRRLLKDSLAYLQSRNIPIDPLTEMTYRYYERHIIND